MAKIHCNDDQLDGWMTPRCGRGIAVPAAVFEATPPRMRCQVCERDWFPRGQPDWHYEDAVKALIDFQPWAILPA